LDAALEDTEDNFGVAARERYETVFARALDDVLENPDRPGVRQVMFRWRLMVEYGQKTRHTFL
jgi:hypothetical protein